MRSGRGGLRDAGVFSKKKKKLPGPVREKIVEIKKREPFLGSSGYPIY